jgi:SAM-dependent methyltransferase
LERAETIKALIRQSYEDPRVVTRYATVGLWPAEESLVLDYIPDDAKVLDLGCGGGRTAVALAELGLDVVGIDISEAMVRLARQQASIAGVEAVFEVGDATALALPESSFDAVLFAYNGMELLPEKKGKEQAIQSIAEVLKPGGVFIFSVHSIFALNDLALFRAKTFLRFCLGRITGLPMREQELGERFIEEDWEEAKYLQLLPPNTWRAMLREAGFEILLYNSLKRLEKGRKWSFWGHFEDEERFFVARKL